VSKRLIVILLLCIALAASVAAGAHMEEENAKANNIKEVINPSDGGDSYIDSSLSDNGVLSIDDGHSADENEQAETGVHGIAFAQQEYFYKDTVHVEIISGKPCEIYFTLDGSDPDKTKTLYREPIELRSKTILKVYPIKAKGYYEDGTETDTIVHTYFVGKDIRSRFNTLVFSITSDPYNLYDYEHGILVAGKLRDDFIKNNPWKEIEPPDPANFNIRGRESEREVYLEVIEPDGTGVASQNAGIRVYGGWSRANRQKSLKIYARREYDEINNKIRYEFFPNKRAASGDGRKIAEFKRLVLRNCGNDNGFAFIRDELFHTLAGLAGFRDYEAVRPAALFINGEYRGCLWLHEVYCDEYFEQHYGKYAGTFEILEGGETYKSADGDEGGEKALKDYEKAYSYVNKNIRNDEIYEELCELIDVENYLEYYALQIYILNEDWPHNNYKVYRYYAAEGEEYGEAPFDGKWRYLLHDLDFSFGIYGARPTTDNISKYISTPGKTNWNSPLFSKLLQRDDCLEYFIKRTLDLINGVFSPDNFNMVLDELNDSRLHEQMHMYDKGIIDDWVRPDHLPDRIEDIKKFNKERAEYILERYRKLFNLGQIYRMNVKPPKGAGVRINGIETFEEFEGRYYSKYETVLTPLIPAGEEFSHWVVNGEAVEDYELIIKYSDTVDNRIEISYELKKKPRNPGLIITEVCSDGDSDYIILYNPYKEDINLLGYSLTDDKNEPGKLVFTMRILRSGESLKILGETNRQANADNTIRAGFNLRDGETVALYYYGELVDEVTIPDLKDGSTYIRNLQTLKFSEEPRPGSQPQ